MDDQRWMEMAQYVSGWSKDRSRKTGAVIVDRHNNLVTVGHNGFPRGIADVDARHQRPAKYQWTEHAERNAIYSAARVGAAIVSCRMYITWYPCADCARAIIQSGITELVAVEPDWSDKKWGMDFLVVRAMLLESGVICRFLAGYSAPVSAD